MWARVLSCPRCDSMTAHGICPQPPRTRPPAGARRPDAHPMHTHLVTFAVLAKSGAGIVGTAGPSPYETGRKDTAIVPAGAWWRRGQWWWRRRRRAQ